MTDDISLPHRQPESRILRANSRAPNLTLYFSLVCLLLLLASPANGNAEPEPIDVLRQHLAAGIALLGDSKMPPEQGEQAEQQRALCALAHEAFDFDAFSRLALAGNWRDFSDTEQRQFVAVFADFLCRYYISRLRAGYQGQQVSFIGQTYSAKDRANVRANVKWRDIDVPVDIRMARRKGRWKAYDLAIAGISGVLIYRAQFEAELLSSTPAQVIEALHQRAMSDP